jgi:ADP-ribose pyrophosphatase
LFYAKNLFECKSDLDEDEFIEIEYIDLDILIEKILRGEIKDAKTVAAVLKYKLLK